jgi:hypothetical protein
VSGRYTVTLADGRVVPVTPDVCDPSPGLLAHPRVFVVVSEGPTGMPGGALAVCPTREAARAYAAHLAEHWGARYDYLAVPWVEAVPTRPAPAPPAEGETP